ncbi:MAG: oligoendopeptidase F [Phycisphaerae bacterium]|nr:oligoendopeptidase F [Phycisphaerae bacterium]
MNRSHARTTTIKVVMATIVLALAHASTAQEVKKVPERSEIDAQYLWAMERIYPDKEAWEKEFTVIKAMAAQVTKFKGTLGNGAEDLLKVLDFRDNLEPRMERLWAYASHLSDQDTRVGEYQGMKDRVMSLFNDYSAQTAWLLPELTAIPFETLKTWMKENDDLAVYGHYFDDLFRQKEHILSPREEELLALTGKVRSTPGSAYNYLTNADIKFPKIKDEDGNEVELDDSAFYLYMRSTDRRVRKDAYEAIVGTYADYRNTAAALLNGAVQSHILTVKARNYDSCLAAALDGSNIPVEVYNTLVETVNENLPLLHRYQTLRKKVLKLDDGVHAYDLFAPLITGQKYEVEYDKAAATVIDALQPLGKEYLTQFIKGLATRWVDVYPTKGKRSGAYSGGSYLTEPYVLLNFHGSYEDMSTLAHEMGHSMHSYFTRTNQPYVYSDYDIFCAEVASVTNEILLQHHVLAQTEDPKLKLYLLVEFLEGMRGTVFRQTMFSEFEQRIHEMAEAGQPLTADAMGAEYRKIMKKYYGPDYVHDELVDNYWIRIPHFYYNFYVYKYATSYCAASNIARRITGGEDGAVEAYLSFLKSGGSKYPIDLLKMARVDMTSPKPVNDAMKIFKDLLDQTEGLLNKM